MHTLRVVTWNAEGMFVAGPQPRRASPHDAPTTLKKLDADVIVIPEFGETSRVDQAILTALHSLGYQTIVYGYQDGRLGEYGAALLSRLPVRSHVLHHFANTKRRYIEAEIELPGGKDILRLFGLHLDDRTERLRLEQIEHVIMQINKVHVGETVVMGDFNAMSKRSLSAKLLGARSAGTIAARLPHAQLRSMSTRVNQMAAGTTIARLLDATMLHDLDPGHHLTISAKQEGLAWAPTLKIAKIDWLFGTKHIETLDYKVLPDVGSDHRPVLATLRIT